MKKVIFILCLAAASAWSDEVGDLWKADSPNQQFVAATRRIPGADMIWREDLDGTRLVVFGLSPAPEIHVGSLYFAYTLTGRLPETIGWTPDSEFIVFTTQSSGGHSPWHHNAYVFSVSAKRVVEVDGIVGLVVSPDFQIKPPHSVVFKIGPSGADGVDAEHPTDKEVDLSTLFKQQRAKK